MIAARGALPAALTVIVALMLTGCSSMRGGNNSAAAPEQLQPVQQSTVAQTALPPIGQDGSVQVAGGSPMTPGPLTPDPALTGQPGTNVRPDPTAPGTTAVANNDGFVSLDAVGSVPSGGQTVLQPGFTAADLSGGWTVVSGPTQCRLNITQTAKTGTSRFRASTPGCQLAQLAAVSSWQLAGTQVQLFDENSDMVAALILSGNRFIGTLAGGQGISMVR